MARKPKTAPVADVPQAAVGVELPFMDDAPAPTRRGRKPKAAMSPELDTAVDSSDAAIAAKANDAVAVDVEDEPLPSRRCRKPKQRTDDAAVVLPQDDAHEQLEAEAHQPEAAAEPALADSDAMIAEMDVQSAEAHSSEASSNAVDPGTSVEADVSASPSLDEMARAKPAARWDRATDTVQFDWPDIERTAAQDRPNQAMAKLLIAARAEGANSRWPL